MTQPRPYSEATVRLAVEAIVDANWRAKNPGNITTEARAVLDALAAAGVLLPEGAETRTEWGVERTYPGLDPVVIAYPSRRDAELAAGPLGHFEGRPLMERSTWATPWVEVDAVRLAVGDESND